MLIVSRDLMTPDSAQPRMLALIGDSANQGPIVLHRCQGFETDT